MWGNRAVSNEMKINKEYVMRRKFNARFSVLIGTQSLLSCVVALLILAACKQPVNNNTSAPKTWTVTMQYDGACGTADAKPNPAAKGEKITISAEPNSRHKFKAWELVEGDVVIYSINTNPATFTMPDNNVTIRAEFEFLPDITLDKVIYGYEQPVKKSISVTDLGIDTQAVKNIELGMANESPFVLDEKDLKNKIIVGNVLNFLVQPQAGLKVGTYIDTVIVTHNSGKATFYIGVTVSPKPIAISGLVAENREYDGTTNITLTGTAKISGVIDGEDVKLDIGGAAIEAVDFFVNMGDIISLSFPKSSSVYTPTSLPPWSFVFMEELIMQNDSLFMLDSNNITGSIFYSFSVR